MKINEIIMGSQGGGIGDNLQITPIFKYFKNSTIEIKNNENGQHIAPLYEGMADIIFKSKPILQEESFNIYGDVSRHHPLRNGALNYLHIFGIENKVSPIPWILLKKDEIEWAREFLKDYKNPLAIVCSNSGYKGTSTASYRFLDFERWQYIINEYSKKYTILQFGLPNDTTNLNNIIPLLSLSIRQMAACFYVIGKCISIDTGPYHLALAVGAYVKCLVPTFGSTTDYFFGNWSYSPEMFDGEIRANYYLFENYKEVFSDNIFF
jgi:hypothetical protein